MSATPLSILPLVLSVGELSPILSPLRRRPLHWLDIARPVYRFLAHPIVSMGVYLGFYVAVALVCVGWVVLVML